MTGKPPGKNRNIFHLVINSDFIKHYFTFQNRQQTFLDNFTTRTLISKLIVLS